MSVLDGELTSAAMCWRLERRDGAGIALTSHDRAIDRNGIRYSPVPALTPASVTRGLGLDPHSGEASGALSSEALNEADLAVGRWDGARLNLAIHDWADPDAQGIDLMSGELGSVAINGESFSAELRGAAARLDAPVCPATSAECRAELGDRKCRVDLAGRRVRATVAGVSGTEIVLDRMVDERFVLGLLRYMSGANCGLSTLILSASSSTLQVRDLPRGALETGTSVELVEGCDKRLETCSSRFSNAANFRGEPHLPGTDMLTRYPGI